MLCGGFFRFRSESPISCRPQRRSVGTASRLVWYMNIPGIARANLRVQRLSWACATGGRILTDSRPHAYKANSWRPFSATQRKMTAEKIDGTAIAKRIRVRLQAEIKQKQETNPRYKPSLTIIQGN